MAALLARGLTRGERAVRVIECGDDIEAIDIRDRHCEQRTPTRERVLGLHPGAIEMAPDFDEYLGDEFWGLKD